MLLHRLALVLGQFPCVTAEVNVAQDALRLECDSVVIYAHIGGFLLFSEIRDVIAQPKEVLLEGVWSDLASNLKLSGLVLD